MLTDTDFALVSPEFEVLVKGTREEMVDLRAEKLPGSTLFITRAGAGEFIL